METIQWWWVSSPCLCNLSLRHTEISSLITDYYIINEMLYGLACVALTDVTLVALFIATSRGGIRIGSVMHSFLIICHSRHMWFFEKNSSRSNVRAVSVQPISFLFRSVRSHENAKCRFRFYSIAAIERFSSEFHSVALKFFSVFLDYTPGIELINRDTRQKRKYHFQ